MNSRKAKNQVLVNCFEVQDWKSAFKHFCVQLLFYYFWISFLIDGSRGQTCAVNCPYCPISQLLTLLRRKCVALALIADKGLICTTNHQRHVAYNDSFGNISPRLRCHQLASRGAFHSFTLVCPPNHSRQLRGRR